jgi:hypothetical protein
MFAAKGSMEAGARCGQGGLTATMTFMYELLIHDQLFRPTAGRESLAERRRRARVHRGQRIRLGLRRRPRTGLRPRIA